MAELVRMIRDRQGGKSIEVYANEMGLRGSTLSRYYNQERSINLSSLRKMARYFEGQGDSDMIQALSSYALNLDELTSSPN